MTDFKWIIGRRKTNALRLIENAVASERDTGNGYALDYRLQGTPHDYYVANGLVSAGYLDLKYTGPRRGKRFWPTEKGRFVANEYNQNVDRWH